LRAAWKWGGRAIAGILVMAGVAAIPATTLQGVNYQVAEIRLPLGLKALDFFQRHWHTRRLAGQLFRDCATPSAKAEAAFRWVREHIRPQPRELPVVDDHVWHIVIRGYGDPDQMADVFCTLCHYGGLPAFFFRDSSPHRGVWAAVRIGKDWSVCSPAVGRRWMRPDGSCGPRDQICETDPAGRPPLRDFPPRQEFDRYARESRSGIQSPVSRLRALFDP